MYYQLRICFYKQQLFIYEPMFSEFKSLEMALFRQTLRLTTMTRSVQAALYHEKVERAEGKNVNIIPIGFRSLTTTRIPAMWVRWIQRNSM